MLILFAVPDLAPNGDPDALLTGPDAGPLPLVVA
jgi:hypothetical protein